MTAIMWASISSEAHLPGVRRDKEKVVQEPSREAGNPWDRA